MTATESNRDEWQVKLTQLIARDFRMAGSVEDFLAVMERPEIHAVLSFDKSSVTDDELYKAMRLFWEIYEQWENGHTQRGPLLSPEYEDLFLDWFEHFQRSHYVPYIPDGNDGLDNHHELFFYLHVAAARAFRIRNGNEMSEEVLSCLLEVKRTMARLRPTTGGPGHFYGEAPSFYTSAGAILAMVFVDLWRFRKEEGRYADALHYLAAAARYYDGAAANFYDGEGINELWPEIAEEEHYWESHLHNLLTGLDVSAEDVVQTFQTIRSGERSYSDWAQVARDCRSIADSSTRAWQFAGNTEQDYGPIHLWGDEDVATLDRILDELYELRDRRGIHLEITDEEWGPVTWSQFWHKAEAWARTQLSPSEYRKMREADEKDAAEHRLKNYFFGSDWSYLTERAQRRLVNADILLNSTQRVAQESLLNELRIAAEELCNLVVWQLLASKKTPPLEFIGEKLKLDEKSGQSDLGISDYIRICRAGWYRDFLVQQNVDRDDVKFLTKQLPNDMSQLRSERNVAEHEVGMSPAPDSPQSFYRGFLGIGRPGILPELARIGRKLQSHRR